MAGDNEALVARTGPDDVSVLTAHFVDEPGHPTREALDRVLAFFAERLTPA